MIISTMTQIPEEPVSVVIPTVGRLDLLQESLPILLDDPATAEVILVLDNPRAEDALRTLAATDPRIRVDVLGFDRELPGEQTGRDIGALRARSDIVLCLDDDVMPTPGLVTGHAARQGKGPDLLVLGYMPVVVPIPSGKERVYQQGYERMCARYQQDPMEVMRSLWGGNFSLRRRHWMRAMQLERVPLEYHADRELGLVLLRLGLRGVFARELRAEHRYRRHAMAVLPEARASALDLLRLNLAYPELVPPPARSRRWAIRILARAMHRPRIMLVVHAALLTVIRASAAVWAKAVEELAIKLLWRLEFDRTLSLADRPSPSGG